MASVCPDLAKGLVKILVKCLVKIWVNFLVKILVKQNNRNNSGDENDKGRARFACARPLAVAVHAVVSVVLFDQNLDQKLTWSGLGQTLGWPRSSPGLGPGQALGKLVRKITKIPPYEKKNFSDSQAWARSTLCTGLVCA